jgi:hypothetical protein
MSKYFNIVGSTSITTELIAPGARNDIKSILLTNMHDTADATVTLFIEHDPGNGTRQRVRLLNTVAIPADSSLFLDNPSMFLFGEEFGLYITVGSSDTVDVLVNQ